MALEDKLDQVKGAVKENAGKLTDDKQMQAEGAVENTVFINTLELLYIYNIAFNSKG